MGGLALLTSFSLDKRLVDPEGFLGPSWLRLPLLLFGAGAEGQDEEKKNRKRKESLHCYHVVLC